METLTCAIAAAAIEVPIATWPGQCYGIASAIRDAGLVEGALRYGHWLGPVSEQCPIARWYKAHKAGVPFQRHGWIEKPDGTIFDPTRWVFEGKAPYLYDGPNDHYDVGGNEWRAAMAGPCPDYSSSEPRSSLQIWKQSPDAERFVKGTLLGGSPGITQKQAFWVANLPPQAFEGHVRHVYLAYVDAHEQAAIPIDNFHMVLGEDA